MIDTDKYEGHTEGPWFYYDDGGISSSIRLYHQPYMDSDGDDTEENLAEIHYDENCIADARLMADAPHLLEFIQKVVEEWAKPNQCNQAFGKDVRWLMFEYGLIYYNGETRKFEVKE